jgi:hypothetical protein
MPAKVHFSRSDGNGTHIVDSILTIRQVCAIFSLSMSRALGLMAFLSLSAPELDALFEYCPRDNEIFEGRLPWD